MKDPVCDERTRGYRVTTCEFLKEAAKEMDELCEGSKIEVILMIGLPPLPKAYIPVIAL